MPHRQDVREAGTVRPGGADGAGRFQVTLITPGWGSSGYYSAEVLEAAGQSRVFPAGTQMFINHQTSEERNERPGGDLLMLAGQLEEDAAWDGQALTAPATVFSDWRQFLAERQGSIGVSIRASAEIDSGEAEGRHGIIVGDIVEAQSVDFVTRAGRGGTFQVLENALPSRVLRRVTARGVSEATANDLREQLQQAVRDQYASGDDTWAYVRDFDPAAGLVWYELETPDSSQLLQHSYTTEGDQVALAGAPVEVRVETRYVPVTPAGDSTTQESRGGPNMPQIEEARLRQLEEAAGRVQAVEAERDTADRERDEARQRLALVEARTAARPVIAAVLAESQTLPAVVQTRVTETVLAGVTAGVEEAVLRQRAGEARTAAEAEVAAVLEASGAGRPRGVGGSTPPRAAGDTGDGETEISEAEFDEVLVDIFGPRPTQRVIGA